MPDPGRFIAWSKQEQGTLLQQLELLESGKVRTGEDQGDGWVDTTDQSISRIKSAQTPKIVERESNDFLWS